MTKLFFMTGLKRMAFVVAGLLLTACQQTQFPVSFHMETDHVDSRKFAFEHQGRIYTRAPFLSHKDMESYYSFPTADHTYGVVLNVKRELHGRLAGMTAANLGKHILPVVNGYKMAPVRLSKGPVNSGKLAIHGGFSPADLVTLGKVIPPADEQREQAVNKFAAVTRPLLPILEGDPDTKQIKDPQKHENRTVLSTRRGRY